MASGRVRAVGRTLESLVTAVGDYDFATLVLTATICSRKRKVSGRGPRDNVLFELGLFMGALGRSRTFIVHSRTTPPMLPSDLAGVTAATFEDRANLEAALGPACTKIKRAIESQGERPRAGIAAPHDEIARLNQQLSDQNAMLSELFRTLITNRSPATAGKPEGLEFLHGAWLSLPSRTHGYCIGRERNPAFRVLLQWRSSADRRVLRLPPHQRRDRRSVRWFNSDIHGYSWLKIETPDRLAGAWWMTGDVQADAIDNLELLRQSKAMTSSVWTRRDGAAFPDWALAALPRTR